MRKATWLEQNQVPHRVADCLASYHHVTLYTVTESASGLPPCPADSQAEPDIDTESEIGNLWCISIEIFQSASLILLTNLLVATFDAWNY